jgi:hypothetical protein
MPLSACDSAALAAAGALRGALAAGARIVVDDDAGEILESDGARASD